MITSSGAKCDVCGVFILPIDPNERVNNFTIQGIKQTLHCDNKCKKIVLNSFKQKDWKLLPSGPLRSVFEKKVL
ncbi:hypothetical protein LCGC14_0351840 [marine sediment metagenome]|uniref:Uncharacterized protein n=1 Tax=marine sediment metagenome TaxID=412755 RepID=A0A0F9TAU5_9ZZZZ